MRGWTSGAGLLALLAVDAAFAAVSSVVDDGYMRRLCFCRDLGMCQNRLLYIIFGIIFPAINQLFKVPRVPGF